MREEILKSTAYDEFKFRLAASQCRLCPALCKNRTHIVVDRGNPRAKIMVIGEAPGETEDLQGKAFVGRAGRSFDETMAAAGFDTNRDLFITNVVKCRPPKNRRPTRQEIANCRPYLEKQIQLLKPKIVILLGGTARQGIDATPRSGLKDKVGKFFELPSFPEIKFIQFYHPAAVFYNRGLAPAIAHHAKALRKYWETFKNA